MYNLSNHINKTIINISTAKAIGALTNVAISDSVITHIVSCNNNAIAIGDIVSMGDYITVNNSGQEYAGENILTPIGAIALYNNGNKIGEITDYLFTKNYKLKYALINNCSINMQNITSYSDKYLILSKKSYKKASKLELFTQIEPTANDSAPQVTPPRPLVSDYSFLVGRVITRDIFMGQKRLFCSGNKITDSIVSDAKTYNKLVELTLYSQKIV